MSDIDLSRNRVMAVALVAGLALGGCQSMGGGTEEPMPQTAQEQESLSEIDQNNDDRISETEFQRHAEEHDVFGEWDENSDGVLEQDEFADIGFDRNLGDFQVWDVDGDGEIRPDELYRSAFNAYDEDFDGYLNASEWDDAGESGLFDV